MPSGLLVVAHKEFVDQLTSKRFLSIFALLLLISALGIYEGTADYNEHLASYSERLQSATGNDPYAGSLSEIISPLTIFSKMSDYIVLFGTILGIAMGFDLISREKENHSLKTLLARPVFRDEIINGKALGSILALVIALGTTVAVSIAILLLAGIVPSLSDFGAILIFTVVSGIFILVYFSLALMMSAISKDSGSALIATLIIFVILSSVVPILGWAAAETLAGPTPVSANPGSPSVDAGDMQSYQQDMQAYWAKRSAFSSAINLISPDLNYERMALAITDPGQAIATDNNPYSFAEGPPETSPGLDELIGAIWANALALFVLPCVFFGVAYAKFMRADIR
ncbi:MAG: type transport system permease protein [Methanofollis sp.]|nr:type transport system permease protein [Methanofollis sp.]